MNKCIHAGCNQLIKPEYTLCFYHYNEMVNNGQPNHWDCSWCREYKASLDAPSEEDWKRLDEEEERDLGNYL